MKTMRLRKIEDRIIEFLVMRMRLLDLGYALLNDAQQYKFTYHLVPHRARV
jgi:hypothetical protein